MANRIRRSTTGKAKKNSSDFEVDDRDLECPVCFDTTNSIPIYECTNGHFVCTDCIPKLEKCPICRNDSPPVRSQKLEEMVWKKEGFMRVKESMQFRDWNRDWNRLPQEDIQQNLARDRHQDRLNHR